MVVFFHDRVESNLALKSKRLRKISPADWVHLRKARHKSQATRNALRVALAPLESEDFSVVVSGSLARDEYIRTQRIMS